MNRDEETLDFFFPMIDDGGGEDIGYYYYWLFVGEEDKIKIKVKEERGISRTEKRRNYGEYEISNGFNILGLKCFNSTNPRWFC